MKSDELHDLAPFVLNSIPKSGTHLLKQILLGIPGMQHHPDKGLMGHTHYQPEQKIEGLKTLSTNEFINGHIFYSKEWEELFKSLNMKHIFVLRDPRDVVVSYSYFIPTLKIHPLYNTFHQEGFTHKDRIKFLIEGGYRTDYKYIDNPNVNDWYKSFSEWIGHEGVLSIRFEDIISSEAGRIQTINRIVDFLWEDKLSSHSKTNMVNKMILNINPATSPTFRKGKIGGWEDEFDEELKLLFKRFAGQLLIDLNYEKDTNW
ncbi:sulfotransferase domain-containing protein [Bacillus seohaeanensis]|uniref:Sulfotransferase domain-containing protein n=1 Tax=Bacillus seohaeanensis TaxID=284580 RepID=A0ABW5RX73_9BACI